MKLGSLIVLTATLLAACGENDNDSEPVSVDNINMEELEAELMIPAETEPGAEEALEVEVTQGDELVDDASEVIFEVWIENEKDDSEMIEAELPGDDGRYEVSYTFSEEEAYFVQPHVTARGSHVMPVESVLVGDAELEDEPDTEEWEEGDMEDHNSHGNDEGNHAENNH
ncbi:FixH family protein [Salisediminibacterium halotolerans]|uniref:YtkA-like n=1 Tax=Salisediminibacterium halotolerans TaxID=517425 RepID=A0A1H9UEG9_9BACI|nr:FixH family protein [Salisediminibacterium haloalkalitolerans]SES07742.1 YtkA-like [Salisediminibacterium haloalkalitolerans]